MTVMNTVMRRMMTMIDIKEYIKDFWTYVLKNDIELYNEFSFQHELGIFLRNNLLGYKVQFERNVSYFGIYTGTIKKEIDIVIFSPDKTEKYAIELKYPRNGQYPEQMYAFTKDILFMEQLKSLQFTSTAAVTLVDDRAFYEGESNSGIYQYYRGGKTINGQIFRPTGRTKDTEHIDINGTYCIEWIPVGKSMYYIVEI